MMCFTPGCGDLTALGAADPVTHAHGFALGSVEQAAGAAEVEDFGLAAEDEGDDVGVAGEPAGFGWR